MPVAHPADVPGRRPIAYVKPRYRPHVDYDAPRQGYVLSGPAPRIAEAVQYWGLPFVGLPLAYAAWRERGYGPRSTAAALLVPIAAMSGIVYWGTQLRELWTFPVPYAPRGYLPQIGLVYAATLHGVYLAAETATRELDGPSRALAFVAAGGVGGGAAGCLFDDVAIRHDLLRVFVGTYRRGEAPGAVVAVYGPTFFTAVATGFAAVTAVAFRMWRR